MKRTWLFVGLAILVLAIAGYSGIGRRVLLTLGLTTAGPPPGMQLIQTASMEPVILTLRKGPRQQGYTISKDPKDQPWIRYKIPAAYISELWGTLGEDGNASSFDLKVWPSTFEPFNRDAVDARAKCQPYLKRREECPQSAVADTILQRKLRAHEFPITVRLPGFAQTVQAQQRRIGGIVPVRNGKPPITEAREQRSGPCIIRDDSTLGLRVFQAPPPLPGYSVAMNGCSSWMAGAGAGTRKRDGRLFRPMHFAKLNPDGSYKFSVMCNGGYSSDESVQLSLCELEGAYGIWSLKMLINAHSAENWDAFYEKAQRFLADHEIGRKD
jgi:hypothetical protein